MFFKRGRYARYVNIFADKTDGYHGDYWEVRYRKTIFFKLGHLAAISSVIVIIYFQISKPDDIFFTISTIFFTISNIIGLRLISKEYCNEPAENRYADYRKNQKNINRLSEKNRKRHL